VERVVDELFLERFPLGDIDRGHHGVAEAPVAVAERSGATVVRLDRARPLTAARSRNAGRRRSPPQIG
jgi:hypothetical protein